MRNRTFVQLFAPIFVFTVLFCWGCATTKPPEKSADELMEEGNNYFEKGYYQGAIDSFQMIIDRYPYSKHCIDAALKLADAYYRREKYDEAFNAYNEFQRLHPKNVNIPYVIYQKGLCQFNQVRTTDRDQSHTYLAREEFERLTKNYPQSEYADLAHWKMRECYMALAEHEIYVGHFYFKNKEYEAAMARYRFVLENYPDLGQYHVALEYLNKCKEILAQKKAG
ncbi:Outer membrane assembly lipoprotein YfiO [uncultured Desulfobacterium sp.]|uniref:Outer membrane assembly lipoprotein YfiO n=1 Tax=uncultured Desulfobacterium sp. TaxID=201089 RepID=A0A445N267_9BACT|nr:Outer membrane assembly lipoprotein YfiO [uncultured Desulfobacterium sp.]